MRFAKILSAAAIVSLAGTPALAQAANVSTASVQRTAALQGDDSELAGGPGIIIAILAAAAVIGGIILAVDSGDDSPVSP